MSREVDQRVVEMRFDNAQFEKGTRESMKTLDRLQEKLRFKDVDKGFEAIDKAQRKVDFEEMGDALDTMKVKFNALDVMAVATLTNITNKIVDTGEKLVKSLSIDQVTSGWSKYNDKVSNVQTIMNATGDSIDTVNGYLDKLMWYSDETSFSFSEMTSALSQMTASGGDIKKMIPMIMGIANATADAGKSGFAFQSTIRNITQSYSAGYLQLQDWKSLNLMGTATKALKQELIDTAVEMGVLKEGEVTIASFENTLSKKWANTKVMEKTFEKYASMMEAAYDLTQKNKGMTTSEALEQLKGQYGELAERAALAAQQATSFGQAIDSTKDAVSSKWLKTFELIFGNKEEATDTWTELANRLYDIFVPPIEKLNDKLSEGLDSGWQKMRNKFGDQADVYADALQQVALASGAVTEEQIQEAGSFAKALQEGGVNAEFLQNGLDETVATLENYLKLSDKEMDARNLDKEAIQKSYDALRELNEEFRSGQASLEDYADSMSNLSGREHLMQSLWNIMDAIGKLVQPIHEAFQEIFPPSSGKEIRTMAEGLDDLTSRLIISDEAAEKIKKVFKGVFSVVKVGTSAVKAAAKAVSKLAGGLLEHLKPVGEVLMDAAGRVGDFAVEVKDALLDSDSFSEMLDRIRESLKKLLSPLGSLKDAIKNFSFAKLKEQLDALIRSGLKNMTWLDALPATVQKVLRPLIELAAKAASGGLTLLGVLGSVAGGVISTLGSAAEFVVSWVKGQLANAGELETTLTNLPAKIGDAVKTFAESFKKNVSSIEATADSVFDPVKQFFNALKAGFDSISGTDVYRFLSLIDVGLLAFTIGQLSKSVKSFSSLVGDLFKGPVTKAFEAMAGSFKALTGALKSWTKNNNSKILLNVGGAMLLFAASMAIVSKFVDKDKLLPIAGALLAFGILLLAAAKIMKPATVKMADAFEGLKARALDSAALWGIAAVLLGVASAAKAILNGVTALMEVLKDGDLADNVAGLFMIASVLAACFIGLEKVMDAVIVADKKIVPAKTILSVGAALVSLGVAVKSIARAVEILAGINNWEAITAGTTAILVFMGGMGALAAAMKKWGSFSFGNGAGFAAMALGVIELAAACKILADLDEDAFYRSVGALVVFLGEFVLVGKYAKLGLRTGGSIFIMANALMEMSIGLWALGKALENMENIQDAIGVLLTLEVLLFGGGGILGYVWGDKGVDAAKSMLLMATGLVALAGAVALYDRLDIENTVSSLVILFDSMAVMAIGLGLLSKLAPNAESAATALMTVAKAILAMAVAVAMFNLATPDSMIAALNAVMIAFVGLLAGGALIEKFPLLGKAMDTLAKSFEKFGSAMLKLAVGTAVLGILSLFAGPLCTAIVNAAPDIGEALIAVVTTLCGVIIACAVPIVSAFDALIRAAVPVIWQELKDALSFLGVPETWDEVFEGVWGAIIDSLFDIDGWIDCFTSKDRPIGALLDWLTGGLTSGAGEEFKNRLHKALGLDDSEETKKKAEETGKYTAEGSAKGMEENLDKVEEASHDLSSTITNTTNGDLKIESPSRVMAETGRYVVLGIAEGIQDESAIQSVLAAISTMCIRMDDQFRDYWGIHSPSDYERDVAMNIPEGAAEGVAEGTPAAVDAVTDMTDRMGHELSPYRLQLKAKDGLIELKGTMTTGVEDIRNAVVPKMQEMVGQIGEVLGGLGLDASKWTGTMTNLANGGLDFDSMFQKAKDAAADIASSVGSGTKTKSRSSGSGTKKSVADTVAEEYEKKLKANKYKIDAASKEYDLWEATDGDTATAEQLLEKKTESLTSAIDLQADRVALAKEQYDELVKKAGADNDKTKDAYATLLDEQTELANLRHEKQETLFKALKERYGDEADTATDEYELWSSLYEDTATVEEKSNRKIENLNRKLAAQAKVVTAAEEEYTALKAEFGEQSLKTQEAYRQWLEEQKDQQELINEINQAQLDAFDDAVSLLEKQEKLVTNRQNMLAKLYDDGDLSQREEAYENAVKEYGENSAEARKAATQGTMSSIVAVGTALNSMSTSVKKLTLKQDKYNKAVEQTGKNSEDALDAMADWQDEQYSFVGFAENLADAFDMDDSGKKMMMQLGYAVARNWQPIQNGFQQVMAKVQKQYPQMAEKLAKAFGIATGEGFTETVTDVFGAITAAVSGDWGQALTSVIAAVLDFAGSSWGQQIIGQIVPVIGKLVGSGGLGEALGGIGATVAKFAASLGPEGWVIAAIVAGVTVCTGLVIKNWDKVADFLQKLCEKIASMFSKLWSSIAKGVKGVWETGVNIVKGIGQGIADGAKGVWNGVKNFCSGVVNSVKSFFGIHSPSTVMAEMGNYLMLGFTEGITENGEAVADSTRDVMNGALEAARMTAGMVQSCFDEDADCQPTIRPVVDLSGAQESIHWMESAFANADGTLSPEVDTTRRFGQAQQRRTELQNAETSGSEERSQDILNALNALGDRIDGVSDSIRNMRLSIDKKKFVGGIIDEVDTQIGRRTRGGVR